MLVVSDARHHAADEEHRHADSGDEHGRRRADERLPTVRPARGNGPLEVVEGVGGRLKITHAVAQQLSKGLLSGVHRGAAPGLGGGGVRVDSEVRRRAAVRPRLRLRTRLGFDPGFGLAAHSPLTVRFGLVLPPVTARAVQTLTHDAASIAVRSAAMPRDPYAFTEPRESPSTLATCASVMSAK